MYLATAKSTHSLLDLTSVSPSLITQACQCIVTTPTTTITHTSTVVTKGNARELLTLQVSTNTVATSIATQPATTTSTLAGLNGYTLAFGPAPSACAFNGMKSAMITWQGSRLNMKQYSETDFPNYAAELVQCAEFCTNSGTFFFCFSLILRGM